MKHKHGLTQQLSSHESEKLGGSSAQRLRALFIPHTATKRSSNAPCTALNAKGSENNPSTIHSLLLRVTRPSLPRSQAEHRICGRCFQPGLT